MAQNTESIQKNYQNSLESAFMLSPSIICILCGPTHIFESANEMYMKMTGHRDIIGKPIREVLPELEGQGFFELLDQVYQTEKPVKINEMLAKLDNGNGGLKESYVNFLYQPNYDKKGTLIGILVHAVDVTEQVLARKRAEESEKRYNMLLMKSPFGFGIFKGKEMVITLANDSIKAFWGKGQNVEGKPLFELLPELKDSSFPSLIDTVYTTGIPYYGNELLVSLMNNGKLEDTYFNFVYQPYFETDEVISGVTVIAYEVTAQALLKKALAEQQKAEQKALERIQESNSRYYKMLMHSPFAFSVMIGKEMIIILANDLMKEFWGKGTDVEGKTLLQLLPELENQPFPTVIRNVFLTGKPAYLNETLAQLKHADKLVEKYFNIIYQPYYEADNTISGVTTLAYDVTEMVLLRKNTEKSETKFRMLMENTPVGTCFLVGRELIVEVANDMTLGYWGKTKNVIGKKLAEAIPELEGQPFLQQLDEVFTTGVTYEAKNALAQLEVNGVLRNYYFDYIYKPIRNDAGEVYGIVSIAIDVTEQVIAEQKLRISLEQFSAMADNISQLAWMVDDKGSLYWYNQRWYDYTGTTFEEVQGWGWQKLHDPDTVDATTAHFKACIEAGTDWEDTFVLRGKDGIYRWFLSRAVPIKDNNGKVIRWFGTNTDITEQIETNKKAEEATQAKQQFLSNMSHEIRTPMNAVIGFTNVLLKTELDEKQRKYINAIKVSGDSLIVLINDILDLAKVDAGKMVFQNIPFQLANSLSTILNIFEIKVQEKNTKLITKYDPNIPEMLLGDPARLHQILMNLMSNAIKFTTEGQITVSVDLVNEDEQKATISFSVEDTGVGIDSDKLEAIFDTFQQATSETSQLFGGTGLGLNIVKQLVEHQGGKVSVKSKINEGSTFRFVMSFDKTTLATKIEPEMETPPTLENLKILVAEDVRLNQLLIKILLEDLGVEVELADNGKIAIEKLENNHYDIIFMDLHMPEMNGFEATEHIRTKMNMEIPIIAITADVTTVDVEKCKAIGMNDYISKPIDEKMLYKKIIKYLPKTR